MTTKQPISYLEFNNPIHIIWRKGTPNDPFVDRLDITRVVNQRIALLEIPDKVYRVRISGMFEVNHEKYIKHSLEKNEFYCDYTNGFVFFHAEKEAETVSVMYRGRGVLLYPSNRIMHYDKSASESLYEIIEKSKEQVKELIDRTEDFEDIMDRMIVAINSTNHAANNALMATEEAKKATKLVDDAYNTTVLIYQPYVQTESAIRTTYPNPQVGWTVQVYDSGIRYRWNGMDWIPIDALGGNIPKATSTYDGLMSKEHYIKLEEISEKTDYNAIVFICPQEILQGIQDPHNVYPFNGEIIDVQAFVSKKGTLATEIDIETSEDWSTWTSILDKPLCIDAENHKDNGTHTITKTKVKANDVFRLNVPSFNIDAFNLTVNIKIKID
ncbi:hypothetical protein [Metasolibacillus meyeri]|uniref:hypothetical protein n=1 Tax=Metasolibacillus meyeri TaxID=1071052 RepID=UPI000D31F00B|nr:hypothetical protein [Metasolibacillus meyeri]